LVVIAFVLYLIVFLEMSNIIIFEFTFLNSTGSKLL
jgi:hypothetical protein